MNTNSQNELSDASDIGHRTSDRGGEGVRTTYRTGHPLPEPVRTATGQQDRTWLEDFERELRNVVDNNIQTSPF